MEALSDIAQRRGLRHLRPTCAFGCSHGDRMIGNFGDVAVFGFHATKFSSTFEGSLVATNDDDLAQRIRLMQNFGFTGLDTVVYVGTNGKMSGVSAMGLTGLESLDELHNVKPAQLRLYANAPLSAFYAALRRAAAAVPVRSAFRLDNGHH